MNVENLTTDSNNKERKKTKPKVLQFTLLRQKPPFVNNISMKISPDAFRHLGLQLMGIDPAKCRSQLQAERKFRAMYGTSWLICSDVWGMLDDVEHPVLCLQRVKADHLLWALMLLKTYSTEDDLAGRVNVTTKTFRLWCWRFIMATADLLQIKVKRRRKNILNDND